MFWNQRRSHITNPCPDSRLYLPWPRYSTHSRYILSPRHHLAATRPAQLEGNYLVAGNSGADSREEAAEAEAAKTVGLVD